MCCTFECCVDVAEMLLVRSLEQTKALSDLCVVESGSRLEQRKMVRGMCSEDAEEMLKKMSVGD